MKNIVHKKKHITKTKVKNKKVILIFNFCLGILLGLPIVLGILYLSFEKKYQNRVYPGVKIANIDFGGQTQKQVKEYWLNKNLPFKDLTFTFKFEDKIATISGDILDLGFDATLSATQAISVGRSNNFFSNLYLKYQAWTTNINLNPLFRLQEKEVDDLLDNISQKINIPPQNALFEFTNGKVAAFKLSKNGRAVDINQSKDMFKKELNIILNKLPVIDNVVIILPVKDVVPETVSNDVNLFGITELIGSGESYFRGSIPGRIHNVALAASRINGVLINPGETFSFNNTVGDISAATGYKQAYIIKNGRTVLDDGGGVCQVSTTLFRAALNSGLPIAERHAHAYRVGYYEQGGWKPGFDATVYDPGYDLKIKNDTNTHILIQTIYDSKNLKLTFEFYGKKDGRTIEISPVKLSDPKPAPADVYQDDPTLPIGTVKQVDWAATGIKASFSYKVTKNNDVLFNKTFTSNFIPWQAVFLKGTKT